MRYLHKLVIALLVLLAGMSFAYGATLEWAGVIGNSGEQGKALVRGSTGRGGGGVVTDRNGHILVAGGDRINVLDKDGHLLWETKLPTFPDKPEDNWVVTGTTFAIGGDDLYFLAGKPLPYDNVTWSLFSPIFMLGDCNLCRVAIREGATVEVIADKKKISWVFWGNPIISLTSDAAQKRVFIGWTSNYYEGKKEYKLFEVDTELGALTPVFQKNMEGRMIALDENGQFFLGTSVQINNSEDQLEKFDMNGDTVPGWTAIDLPDTGAVPNEQNAKFHGNVFLTNDALWLTARGGCIGRYDRDLKPKPGVVCKGNRALTWVTQIIDGPEGTYFIKSDDALYQAKVENDKLVLLKRYGSLPQVDSLSLMPNGMVAVSNGDLASGMLWFDFQANEAAAVPKAAQGRGPSCQGFIHGYPDGDLGVLGLNLGEWWLYYTPKMVNPRPKKINIFKYFAPQENGESKGFKSIANQKEYDGFISQIVRMDNCILGIDSEKNSMVIAPVVTPPTYDFSFALAEGFTNTSEKITSMAPVSKDLLLVASRGTIGAYEVTAEAIKEKWVITNYGDGEDKQFGNELFLSATKDRLVVSDKSRHRVLLFSFAKEGDRPTFLAQFGETDKSGDDKKHVNEPTLVSMNRDKVVVYDSSNQRVVKFVVKQ